MIKEGSRSALLFSFLNTSSPVLTVGHSISPISSSTARQRLNPNPLPEPPSRREPTWTLEIPE
jgi:hypothetical protein